MNKVPKSNQNIVNISRIADHVKDNELPLKRQSIIISHYKSLELEMLTKNFFKNISSGIYYINEKYEGVLKSREENNLVKYEFKMLKAFDDMDMFDYKFNYFTKISYILFYLIFIIKITFYKTKHFKNSFIFPFSFNVLFFNS